MHDRDGWNRRVPEGVYTTHRHHTCLATHGAISGIYTLVFQLVTFSEQLPNGMEFVRAC